MSCSSRSIDWEPSEAIQYLPYFPMHNVDEVKPTINSTTPGEEEVCFNHWNVAACVEIESEPADSVRVSGEISPGVVSPEIDPLNKASELNLEFGNDLPINHIPQGYLDIFCTYYETPVILDDTLIDGIDVDRLCEVYYPECKKNSTNEIELDSHGTTGSTTSEKLPNSNTSSLDESKIFKNSLNTINITKNVKQCDTQKAHVEKKEFVKPDKSANFSKLNKSSPFNLTSQGVSQESSASNTRAHFRHRRESYDKFSKKENYPGNNKVKALADRCVVYVGDIPSDFSECQLRERFQRFGNIRNIQIKSKERCDSSSFDSMKKMKKYGFITFFNGQEAAAAIERGNDGHSVKLILSFGGRRQFAGKEYRDLDGNVADENFDRHSTPSSQPPNSEDDYELLLRDAIKARGVELTPHRQYRCSMSVISFHENTQGTLVKWTSGKY